MILMKESKYRINTDMRKLCTCILLILCMLIIVTLNLLEIFLAVKKKS